MSKKYSGIELDPVETVHAELIAGAEESPYQLSEVSKLINGAANFEAMSVYSIAGSLGAFVNLRSGTDVKAIRHFYTGDEHAPVLKAGAFYAKPQTSAGQLAATRSVARRAWVDGEFGLSMAIKNGALLGSFTMLRDSIDPHEQPLSGKLEGQNGLRLHVRGNVIEAAAEKFGASPVIVQLQNVGTPLWFKQFRHRPRPMQNWPHVLSASIMRWSELAGFDQTIMIPAEFSRWFGSKEATEGERMKRRYSATAKSLGFKKDTDTGFYVYDNTARRVNQDTDTQN